MTRILATISFILLFASQSYSQDTLPGFTATTRGNNRILISWTNTYEVVKQIIIQRSYDSTKNFKSILTIPDPTIPQNGFVDSKAPTSFMFYRLFILLDNGKYVYSKARRASWDTSRIAGAQINKTSSPVNGSKQVVVSKNMTNQDVEQLKEKIEEAKKREENIEPEKFFVVVKKDSIVNLLPEKQFKRFRDSLVTKTKDTMLFSSVDTIVIKTFIPVEVYRPSQFVFTERDGNVSIVVPQASRKQFSLKFYEDDHTPLFEIKQVKESHLILDKSNFLHAGWFRFELYEEGKLKEKHRFFIPKD